MNSNEPSEVGMLSLGMRQGYDLGRIKLAAEHIRQLTGVLRVRVDSPDKLEIVFDRPTRGLLRDIHTVLKSTGTEVIAAKTR